MTLQMEINDFSEMEFAFLSSLVSGQNSYDLDNTRQSFAQWGFIVTFGRFQNLG
jgi:hypothetical protein